jgi:hypothetical protein
VKVQLLDRRSVDDGRWNAVIADSIAETLYPYTWYLDAVAENWSALVLEDYRFIMPVVWKRKYGIRYIYQPFYTQQLGVFSKEYVDPTIIRQMISLLPRKFRFATFNFNAQNLVGEEKPFQVEDKSNYVLDLSHGYETLQKLFSQNAKRNIKKSLEVKNQVSSNISCEEVVEFKRQNDVIQRKESDYQWLLNLLETVYDKGNGRILGIRDQQNLIAVAYFAFSQTRAIYLVSASNNMGKDRRSMFRIVDAFIREYAGKKMKLDFEGSSIPSVARFFAGFGARPEIYQNVSFSRLPALINPLK